MANLNIVEVSGLARGSGQGPQIIQLPPVATQNRSLTGTSQQSSAFNTATKIVRLKSDVDCYVEFGTSPTAATTSLHLTAGAVEYFGVKPGDVLAART